MDAPDKTVELLRRWNTGDSTARDTLIEQFYDELRILARRALMRERQDHTLQATALVHELYVRLFGQSAIEIKDRGHFFALAATVMRRILVDHARARLAERRGGGAAKTTLQDASAATHTDPDIIAIDQALERLEEVDPRKARVVELKFFVGLTESEIADTLGIGRATVERDWCFAKSWLQLQLQSPYHPHLRR
jgi:RNA polymerase sigma factor (TIGR02999 family)